MASADGGIQETPSSEVIIKLKLNYKKHLAIKKSRRNSMAEQKRGKVKAPRREYRRLLPSRNREKEGGS